MRPVVVLAAAVVACLAGCTSLERGQGALVERRPGTEVTDAELQARGEWTAEDAAARRLLGPGRPVRLASQARALCDVVRVGRHELVVPSPSAAVTRLLGLAYEPRRFHARRAGAWVLLRRDAPPVIVEDVEGRPPTSPDDASPRVFVELGRRLARQVEGLERVAGDVRP